MELTAAVKYRRAYYSSRPMHGRTDDFSLRHPPMPIGQRAKIFAPFAALQGYEEAVEAKERRYVPKKELNEDQQLSLNRALAELCRRVPNGREARQHPVTARVTWFVPCSDENHEDYGRGGLYETRTGTVWKIDPVLSRSLILDDREIAFSDIAVIRLTEEA